jgi:DNA polymerase III alpha subunit
MKFLDWLSLVESVDPQQVIDAALAARKNGGICDRAHFGDCKEISQATLQMLQKVGIQARLTDGTIYLPITSLKGIGESARPIVDNKPYKDLQDFVTKSDCTKGLYVALASGGALNCLVDDPEIDDEYFLDFWVDYSKSKSKSKKNIANDKINNNSLSLLEMREISQNNNGNGNGNDLLNQLEDF